MSKHDDEPTRTILDRATRRAKLVSERCLATTTIRLPMPGAVERVDVSRLERTFTRPAPRDEPREDAYEAGLVALIGLPRSRA